MGLVAVGACLGGGDGALPLDELDLPPLPIITNKINIYSDPSGFKSLSYLYVLEVSIILKPSEKSCQALYVN
jgi:hypothetical protein